MSNTIRLSIPVSSAVIAAPRQVWLATLGAAAVTREWAQKEGGSMIRTLVKEGSVVESRTIRLLSDRVEASVKRATKFARRAQSGLKTSAESLANIARSFVRNQLPSVHARLDVETPATPRKSGAKAAKRTAASSAKRASVRRSARTRTPK